MDILNHLMFLEKGRDLGTAIQVQYDTGLVLLSVLLAVFSSYIAFLVSSRIRKLEKYKYNFLWLWAGSFALGCGIWAMHFVGMLAYTFPVVIHYDVTITAISVFPAILSSLIVLKTSYSKSISISSMLWRSMLMGFGIALMHYIGMSAMIFNGVMRYDLWLYTSSILVAVVLAYIALRLKLQADKYVADGVVFSVKLLIPAVIMGGAISAMHYIGMAAMYVFPATMKEHIPSIWSADELANIISIVTLLLSGLLLIAIEVSNRFDLYRKIKSSEQNLAITLNSIADAVITTDEKGIITRMNPVAENLTGRSSKESLGMHLKTVFSIIDSSTREPISNLVDKVIATGEIIHLSNHATLISKNGNEYQINDSAAPIVDRNNIVGMVLVFNDVTEQIKLRDAASKSRRDMQSIMDNSPAVIYVKDIKGRFTFINKKFVELFHAEFKDVIGKTLFQIFPNDIAYEMDRNDQDILTSGKALESEEVMPHDDGLHTYHSIKFPLRDNNKIYAICRISTDITDKRVKDEQLRRSQKMDALGQLTGGIAHDYNNMLSVILGYSELIEKMANDQPKLISYIREIQHAGERGAKLTGQLLTFSRQKSSTSEIVSINKLIRRSQLMLEKTMTARIKTIFKLTENLWPVYIDVSEFEDAILNISINAMHAIEGNGKVTFETRNDIVNKEDEKHLQVVAGEYVLLSITDTGCGMDHEIKENIFDPFFSTKGELGTGLGLSQVYDFVLRTKGNINILSEPGHGTRFTLYFPRHYGNGEKKLKSEEIEQDFRGNQTILIVDDEPSLIKLSSYILTQQGYKVFIANSGKEALSVLEQESIDLLFSDIIMPEMNGYQLAEIVHNKYPDIKIQLASGFSNNCHIDSTNSSLHKKLLHKPYHSKELLSRVQELLSN